MLNRRGYHYISCYYFGLKNINFSITLAAVLLMISNCGFSEQWPSDEKIWEAFVYLRQSPPSLSPPDETAVAEAQQQFMIERLGIGDVFVQPSGQESCLPDQLRGATQSIHGRSFRIRIFSKASTDDMTFLDFTRWDGVDGWWASTSTAPDKCYGPLH